MAEAIESGATGSATPMSASTATEIAAVRALGERIGTNVERVIVGKPAQVRLVLTAVLAGGHILIEDVPGVGKTVLAKALARSIGALFKRIQFTPDLLPGDVTGMEIYNQRTAAFEYRPGPIMAQIVLADEINRATPKTQSALLEAMEEGHVTVGGVGHPVTRPFTVVATQNPVEYEGTFPLPEAQLDRFLIRLSLGYPDARQEMEVLARPGATHPVDALAPVCGAAEVLAAQAATHAVYVDALVREYIVTLVGETRRHPDVYLGASPRGSLAVHGLAQAHAALDGRAFVLPDDVKTVAPAALAHRLILRRGGGAAGAGGAGGGGRTPAEELVRTLLDHLPVPGSLAAGEGEAGRGVRGKG